MFEEKRPPKPPNIARVLERRPTQAEKRPVVAEQRRRTVVVGADTRPAAERKHSEQRRLPRRPCTAQPVAE